ncbi:MAG: hypothetical protein KJO17_03375 [Acidimicrobiia bacterium]|nr:hypothetical protein [Acidimicrobiia bacterium]NNL71105.1 hypothetical protein [Acidimicrobiia bacterium]
MRRIAIFSDSNRSVTAGLIRCAIAYATDQPEMSVAALVTRNPQAWEYRRGARFRVAARAALVAMSNSEVGWTPPQRFRVPPEIPVLTSDEFPTNSAELRTRLRDELGVDTLLSLYFGGILSEEFLSAFPDAVNYHPALLPRNRGLAPIGFAIYAGDAQIGFTFHRMTPGIDEGPILAQGSVPVGAGVPVSVLTRQLGDLAVATLPSVLDEVRDGAPGSPQAGEATYHSRIEVRSMINIAHPEEVTRDELQRRLNAFGSLRLTIDGGRWPVSRLAPANRHRLRFTTSDGIELGVSHLADLPAWLVRARRRLGGFRPGRTGSTTETG